MKPLKLTMQAFGAYAGREVVDFARLDRGLFLMTGPTGSGKTTVFDALKFALFGEMSGSVREAKTVRSGYAAPDTITFVELVFEHGGKQYRAYRAPKGYRVVSKRKTNSADGLKDATEEMSLECLSDGISLAGKAREMTEAVEALLGISAEQFSSIVMIAQGEFAQLLNAPTKTRQSIFRKVFGTEVYQRAQEALGTERDQVRDQLKSQSAYLETVLAGIRPSDDSAFAGTWQALRAQKDGVYHTDEYCELLQNLIDEDASHQAKGKRELDEVKEQLEVVNQTLGAARSAAEMRARLQEAQQWVEQNEQVLLSTVQRDAELTAQKPQRDALSNEIALAEQALPQYAQLTATSKKLAAARASRRAAADQRADAAAKLQALEAKRKQLAEKIEGFGNLAAQQERLVAQSKQLEGERKRLENIASQLRAAQKKKAACSKAQAEAAVALETYTAAAEKHTQANAAYLSHIAGFIAQGLESGKPCPVCGSTSHPALAHVAPDAVTKEQVDAFEQAANVAQAKATQASSTAAAAQAEHEAAEQAVLESARAAFGEVRLPAIAETLAGAEQELQAAEADCVKQQAALKSNTEELKQTQTQASAAEAEAQATTSVLQQATECETNFSVEIAGLEAAALQLKEGLVHEDEDHARREIQTKKAELAQQQRAADDAAARARNLKETLAAKQAVITSCKEGLGTTEECDVGALNAQKDELDAKVVAWTKGIGELESRITNHKAKLADIAEARTRTEKLEEHYKLINDLAAVARAERGGDRAASGRVTFETYVQAVYFRQVLAAANERLRIMSESRYELLHKQSVSDARALAGLEMEVLDRNTGKTRDVSSLSGGETFLASLALALGFADVIQAQASGVVIDAIFIDEGFGSLDDETCATALKVLDRLAADDRLVGIISHVDQLKQHITRQLVVEKGTDGSHLHLEL